LNIRHMGVRRDDAAAGLLNPTHWRPWNIEPGSLILVQTHRQFAAR
jgi:hypothetical protein